MHLHLLLLLLLLRVCAGERLRCVNTRGVGKVILTVRLYFAVERDTARGEMAAGEGSCAVGVGTQGMHLLHGVVGVPLGGQHVQRIAAGRLRRPRLQSKETHAVDATKAGEEVDK